MTGEQDTGNPEGLPLAERTRRGLLAGESELWLWEIMELEFPAATSFQDKKHPDYIGWEKAIEAAIRYGSLGDGPHLERFSESATYRSPATNWKRPKTFHIPGYDCWRIPREPYRTWRATQSNAPTGSLINLWTSLLSQSEPEPLPQGEPDKPEQGAAGNQNPALNRQCVTDKAHFLDNAVWNGTQQTTVKNHPEVAYFKGRYDTPTLLKWASEIDPRPKNQRGGRPRKS
ncbi:MAG: hypothetical protein IPM89_11560 [Candidatus Competibacteraceae bacterium]|nr:MAG: hypothetical protein IPM89_11560 [Candidatus Competibacteraceae bacterium]